MTSRSRTTLVAGLLLVCASEIDALAIAAPGTLRRPVLPHARTATDLARRLDANELNLFVTNLGSFGFDIAGGSSGLYYPNGTSKTALFAAGLWVGGQVGGETRVSASEYGMDWAPGTILPGGMPEDPADPSLIVWKVHALSLDVLGDTAHVEYVPGGVAQDPLLHHGWSEYMANAVPRGAPWRTYRLPVTDTADSTDSVDVDGPDVRGDVMTWAVYNDADALAHTTFNTGPIGLEVRQLLWASRTPGTPGPEMSVFIEYQILHKGTQPLDNAYVSLWSDPDLGGYSDDLVGCDTTRALGYVYNATNADPIYGSTPPALGFELERGPIGPFGAPLPLTSFNKYIGGTDPSSASEAYFYMQGLLPDGSPLVDPTTGQPTAFFHPGDPVSGGGWVDTNPADRRMMMNTGPFTMAPGDTQVVIYELRIGQGASRLASIVALKSGTVIPPDSCGVTLVNCPRTPEYWGSEMALAGTGELSLFELEAIARGVASASVAIDWPDGGEVPAMAALFDGPPADSRERALRAHAALLANLLAATLDVSEQDGDCIFLDGGTQVTCEDRPPTALRDLAEPFDSTLALQANYLNLDLSHRRAFAGVGAGLGSFDGGAGFGELFFGSSLSPESMPDSFPDVELRFDGTQKAYRYLRFELEGGGIPPNGREYRYGGLRDVPFQVWDVMHGVQLDVAFAERAVVTEDGTLLPSASQPTSFDSTWRLPPDELDTGGREYVMVFSRGYGDAEKPDLAVDGFVTSGFPPVLYALWATLRSETDVIDPADRFRFDAGYVSAGSIDERLVLLARQPQDDPAVIAEYEAIAACVEGPSRGEGIGTTCDAVVAALASLVESSLSDGRATIRWYVPVEQTGDVERREGDGDWIAVAPLVRDGAGYVTYVDEGVIDGVRYGYRLSIVTAGGREPVAETSLTPGSPLQLGLAGFVPNPAGRDAVIAFTLPSTGPARLELFDVSGRRVLSREVGSLGPGHHRIALDPRLRAGIYLLRLTREGVTVTAKSVRMD